MSSLPAQLALGFLDAHPSEAARALEELGPAEAAGILSSVEPQTAARVLGVMVSPEIRRCLERMDTEVSSAILAALPAGTAVSVLAILDQEARAPLIDGLPARVRHGIRRRLEFPADTVGRLMEDAANVIGEDFSLESARDSFRATDGPYLYVVDSQQRLAGVLARRDLEDPRERPLGEIVVRNPVSLLATLEWETAREHVAWQEFDVLPVVDREGCLIGTLRHKQVRRTEGATWRDALVPSSGLDTLFSLEEAYCAGLWEVIGSMTEASELPRTARRGPESGGTS